MPSIRATTLMRTSHRAIMTKFASTCFGSGSNVEITLVAAQAKASTRSVTEGPGSAIFVRERKLGGRRVWSLEAENYMSTLNRSP